MIRVFLLLTIFVYGEVSSSWKSNLKKLNSLERYIVEHKGTERPFTGKYLYNKEKGVYRCKVCNSALYYSKDKFNSHCGWPSFDDAIKGAIKEKLDKDGKRIEILCSNCNAHLGHIFKGEGYTKKNVRHCVNSLSLNFKKELKKAYFAGGCFWGVEFYLEKIEGVKEVTSGFMGGWLKNPTYYDVVYKNTGHIETVEVTYDPNITTYKEIAKRFFEIHDPTQLNRQGPDIGKRYQSAIFVSNKEEEKIVNELISKLKKNGYSVVTKIKNKKEFYKAKEHHQNYYEKKGSKPYCHIPIKRFNKSPNKSFWFSF